MSDNLNSDQFMDLYHRTREAQASAIYHHGFYAKPGSFHGSDFYFSDRGDDTAEARHYGSHKIHVRIPKDHPGLAHTDSWEHPDGSVENWYALSAHDIDPEKHIVYPPEDQIPKWRGPGSLM